MSARGKQWTMQAAAPESFIQTATCHPIMATLLYQRGIQTTDTIADFMHSTYPHGLHDPLLMKGMHAASTRIVQALVDHEPIAVYGDYDVDGVTATTLLHQAFSMMGGDVYPYIPHREREGYGLQRGAIDALAQQGIRLLITVDCGISNRDEVAFAQTLGIDVIVTDHHTPPSILPPAYAIVNPKQPGCPYPYKQLVGVGIAFKLVQSLYKHGIRTVPRGRDMLDLVALGTIADIGPLTGENRILVKAGLEAIKITTRPGIQKLIAASGLDQNTIDSMAVAFRLAPRINAAGRLDDARDAYTLLLTDDPTTAESLARTLNHRNRERQKITADMKQAAMMSVQQSGRLNNRIIVVADESYTPGVVGLVAGKLVETWSRPVVVLSRGADMSSGSARSIPGFNIIAALTQCSHLFERFGGHSMAAGLTIQTARLAEFEDTLLAIANHEITDEMMRPTLSIDTDIALDAISWELLQTITDLEPFGSENPQPVFMSRGIHATDVRAVGGQATILKFRASVPGTAPIEAVGFGLGHLAEPLRKHPHIDIVYTLEHNVWEQQHTMQLNIKDFRRYTPDFI